MALAHQIWHLQTERWPEKFLHVDLSPKLLTHARTLSSPSLVLVHLFLVYFMPLSRTHLCEKPPFPQHLT